MAGKKILVADDSLTIQKVIRLALSNEGYEIQAVSDGNDAIQQISLFRPDVILLDVSLPGKNAIELKQEMNQNDDFRGIKFILMSSAFEKVDEEEITRVGFDGRLTKPFDPAHLRQTLSSVLSTSGEIKKSLPPIPPGPPAFVPPGPPPFPPSKMATPPPPPPSHAPIDISDVAASPPLFAPPPLPPSLPPAFSEPPALPEVPSLELWEPGNPLATPPPLPPLDLPPLDMPDLSPEGDQDIQELTRSTLDMAQTETSSPPPPPQMEDQWSIQEGNELPPLTPPPYGEVPPAQPSISSSDPLQILDELKIQEMVREQVQKTLESLSKQLLPEMAERIIKQEIHKLLSE